MVCLNCGNRNPEGSNFCATCGAPLRTDQGEDTTVTFSLETEGDGEEEFVVIGHDQTKDGPRDPMAYVIELKSGVARIYPQATELPIFRVEDIDRDHLQRLRASSPQDERDLHRIHPALDDRGNSPDSAERKV